MLSCLLALLWHLLPVTDAPSADDSFLRDPYVVVNTIRIEGARKTQPSLILRELDFEEGDTLLGKQVHEILQRNRNKIFNTNLFVTVDLSLEPGQSGQIDLLIKVTERWYIFPMIIFELADRNFNEWWVDRGRDLRRTQYGVRVVHKNFRGRGEELRGTAQFGFTKRFDLGYMIRYLDRKQKNGLGFLVSYAQNKSVAYRTIQNKLFYLSADHQLRDRFMASVLFTHRPQFYVTHRAEARYHYNTIADTIARLNPDYFLQSRTRQQYISLSYQFTWDKRDIAAYPLHGKVFSFDITRAGLTKLDDFSATYLGTSYSQYGQLGKKFYWSAGVRGRVSVPGKQPYFNYRGMGYGMDYLRGYEYYVIDGQHFALGKLTFKREIFNLQLAFPQLIPLRQFQTIPIALYLGTYTDAGYVHSPVYNSQNSRLTNKMLYSSGLGLDMVTFYNTVFRINYSVNRQGEKGFFIHFVRDL